MKYEVRVDTSALTGLGWLMVKKALYAPIPVTPGGAQSAFGNALAAAALAGAFGYGINNLSRAVSGQPGSEPNTLGKSVVFHKMLDASPDLRQQDPTKVKSMFDVMYQFFPAGAAQPHTAAGIVGNMVQYDTVDHKTVNDLITMQKSYSDTQGNTPKPAMQIQDHVMSMLSKMLADSAR
jgi:hypothetical protein